MAVSSMRVYGYGGANEPASPTITTHTAAECAALRRSPANGTFVRQTVENSAKTGRTFTGSVYRVIGGAPVAVTAASIGAASISPKPVDGTVLQAAHLTAPTGACYASWAGCLRNKVGGNTLFRAYNAASKATTGYFKTDTASHPWPQASGASSWPAVPAAMITNCSYLNCDTLGQIETSSPSYGVMHLQGFAIDFPSAGAINVQVLIDNASTFTVAANQVTGTYVPAGVAGGHEFSWNLGISAGLHTVCATALGSAPGVATQPLGCSDQTVLGAKPGKVKKLKLKAKGHGKLKVKWKPAAANGNPITSYQLKCGSMHAKKVPGSKHSKTLKHLHRGARLSCKVRAINGGSGGPGHWSKRSKSVTVR